MADFVGTPTYDDVVQILNAADLSQFERHQLAGALIQTACEVNGGVARRALVALYELQTPGERAEGMSSEHNGRGFDREYGRAASELAERILGGARISGRDMERVLNIVQRFRVQLFVHVPRDTLRWVVEGEDEEEHASGGAAGAAGGDARDDADVGGGGHTSPTRPGAGARHTLGADDDDDDDADFDEDEEEEDMDDFVVLSDDDADEETGGSSDDDDSPIDHKRKRLMVSSEDDDADAAAPPVEDPRVVSAVQAVADPVYADLMVTAFGIRGAMTFSPSVEKLFLGLYNLPGATAIRVFDNMKGVPGLTVSDVHVRFWKDRWLDTRNVNGGEEVIVYVDGAWRQASVCLPDGHTIDSIMRLKLGDSLMWVVPGLCPMYVA